MYIAVDVDSSANTASSRTRQVLRSVLTGIATVVGVVAGMLFLFGGRAIHEFLHVNRLLAEIEADTLALAIFFVTVLMRGAADRIEDPYINEPVSLGLDTRQDTSPNKRP